MKTVITIDNGRITIQVDDEKPLQVISQAPIKAIQPATATRSKTHKASAAPVAPSERVCPICGTTFTPANRLSKFDKDECRKEYNRRYQRDWLAKRKVAKPRLLMSNTAGSTKLDQSAKTNSRKRFNVEPDPEVPWTPSPVNMPPSMPTNITDEAAEVENVMDELRSKFDDPWDCAMCRNAGVLCTMHERMTAAGDKPPVYHH